MLSNHQSPIANGQANNQILPFHFEHNQIRTLMLNNEPWFVAKDICNVLELTNSRMAIQGLDDDEKGVSKVYTLGGEQDMQVINESGLYALVIRSNKPQAKKFRKWITSEVLPSIRQTGMYAADDLLDNPELLRAAADRLIAERNLRKQAQMQAAIESERALQLEHKIEQDAGKVALGERLTTQNGYACLSDAMRAIGYKPQKSIDYLKQRKLLIYRNGAYVAASYAVEMGYMSNKSRGFYGNKERLQAMVTPKGHEWLMGYLPKYLKVGGE